MLDDTVWHTLDLSCVSSSLVTDATLLRLLQRYGHCIHELNLAHCCDLSVTSLSRIAHMSHLEKLSVENVRGINDYTLLQIATHCHQLHTLILDGCMGLSATGMIRVMDTLRASAPITTLSLSGVLLMQDKVLAALTGHNLGSMPCSTSSAAPMHVEHDTKTSPLSSLSVLRMNSCPKLTPASIRLIAVSSFSSSLKELQLGYCGYVDDATVHDLATHCTQLHTLSVYGCPKITNHALSHLRTLHLLQSLDIGMCPHITDDGIATLVASTDLSSCAATLQDLNLYSCTSLTSTAVDLIAQHCPNIQSLGLYGLSSVAMNSIANAIVHCSKLHTVDYGGISSLTDTQLDTLDQLLASRTR
jgi:hypothetical protein